MNNDHQIVSLNHIFTGKKEASWFIRFWLSLEKKGPIETNHLKIHLLVSVNNVISSSFPTDNTRIDQPIDR